MEPAPPCTATPVSTPPADEPAGPEVVGRPECDPGILVPACVCRLKPPASGTTLGSRAWPTDLRPSAQPSRPRESGADPTDLRPSALPSRPRGTWTGPRTYARRPHPRTPVGQQHRFPRTYARRPLCYHPWGASGSVLRTYARRPLPSAPRLLPKMARAGQAHLLQLEVVILLALLLYRLADCWAGLAAAVLRSCRCCS